MSESDHRVRAHVHVSGKVQGVYYRASTREKARDVGVDGWVRNLDDGRVKAVFEGQEEDVEELVDWCRTGSSAAEVRDLDVEFEEPRGVDDFEIRW